MLSLFRGDRSLRAAVALTLALALVTWPQVAEASPAPPPIPNRASEVLSAARSHIGAPYQWGGTGPRFDCSGLVYRVFKETHHLKAVGGSRMSAAGLLRWFQARHLVSRRGGRPGDLVIYNNGTHVGIYLGKGMVISAVVRGVRKHGLRRLTIPFTAFLHTHLGPVRPIPVPAP